MSDGTNLVFNIAALFWSVAMALFPHDIDPPLMVFSALPLALFAFKIAKLLHLYSTRVGATLPPDPGGGAGGARPQP